MPTGKTCGNCDNFVRMREWNGPERNGLCEAIDCGRHSSSSYAKTCNYYSAKKYDRKEKHKQQMV